MDSISKKKLPLLVVLMAGGGGTRLWPLSRPEEPKQCLPLLGGKSLFASTFERLRGILPPDEIFVVSNSELEPRIRSDVPEIPRENFFCEPSPRNTAPAVAFALACLRSHRPRFVMACLPSDHYIANTAVFHKLLQAARMLAENGYLVTLGIEPSGPVTGYGYIEQGESIPPVEGYPAFRVRRFTEKPELEQAQEMVRSGAFTWNSGMFFWRSDVIEAEYRRHQPEIAQALDPLSEAFRRQGRDADLEKIWGRMPTLSLDYGILEKSDRVAVLPARGLGWTDIGSWDALVELYRAHPELRLDIPERHYDTGSKSVTVIRKTGSGRILATVGLDDVIIVETDDAILVCQGGKSQDIRKITEIVIPQNSAGKPK
jgi:mannose-1-phosphate guanylyltransferase